MQFPLMIMLLVLELICCNAEFSENPSNVTLLIGSNINALFRCQHQSTEAIIVWRVNGSPVGQFPDITAGSIRENGSLVYTLTIPARSEYNGTVVECVAVFINGSLPERTPPVTLIVLANFVKVPSPKLLVVTLEERHTYACNNSRTNRIYWRVNNSRLSVDIFPARIDHAIIALADGFRLHTLMIGGLPEHNESTIQCVAEFGDGSVEETPVVTFLIQGLLQRVSDIVRNSSTIFWDAPFSLNLTNVDPDIVYCVEVYNITCGRSLLISECDVMETSYTNDALLPGYIYEYTVTPRSNVEGASNGTSLTVIEEFEMQTLPTRSSSTVDTNVTEFIETLACLPCLIGPIVMVLVIIVSCVIYKVKKVKHTSGEQQRGNPSGNVNIEMVKCEAYEAVQLSKQGVAMNDNPAYGEIGVGEYTVIDNL